MMLRTVVVPILYSFERAFIEEGVAALQSLLTMLDNGITGPEFFAALKTAIKIGRLIITIEF